VGSIPADNAPSVSPLSEAGIDRTPPSRKRARRAKRARIRLLHIAVLALIGLILMAWVAPRTSLSTPTASAPTPGGLNGGITVSGATGKMYGGSGPNGACQNSSSGEIITMLMHDFGWGPSFLSPKWQNNTTDQLCNDHWIWETNVTLRVSDVFATLQWPPDLLQPQYLTQGTLVQPLTKIDPVAAAKRQQQQQQQGAGGGGSCISLTGGIDFGACLSGFWNAIAQGVQNAFTGFIDWVTSFGFMFVTPAALTYKHGVVTNLWTWSLGVADAALALFLVIGGYNAMLRHSLGASYATVLEFLPRIALAAVAANFSLTFIASFIELNNTLCIAVQGAVATAGAGDLSLTFGNILNILTLPFYAAIAYIIELAFAAILSVQMLVRVALLDLLIVLSPIWLLLLGLKQTERWGRLGAAAFAATLFLQFLQIVDLGMGSALVASFGHASATPVTILVGIASLYLAFRLPGMLYGAVLRPVEGAGADAANAGERIAMILAA
jgi:hypothetical protein